MSEQKKMSLNTKQICDLIKACRENGVSTLTFGDLSLCFLPKLEQAAVASWSRTDSSTSLSDTEISEAQFEKTKQENTEHSELELKEEQLAEMMLANPLEFEKLMASGELEDE